MEFIRNTLEFLKSPIDPIEKVKMLYEEKERLIDIFKVQLDENLKEIKNKEKLLRESRKEYKGSRFFEFFKLLIPKGNLWIEKYKHYNSFKRKCITVDYKITSEIKLVKYLLKDKKGMV